MRAEFRLPSGRVATILEFAEWRAGSAAQPRSLVLRDALRGGAATRVEVLELEEREVAPGLFDRNDDRERRRLFGGGAPQSGTDENETEKKRTVSRRPAATGSFRLAVPLSPSSTES